MSVVVVGAGAFGVSAALELARRGHAVTLLDPGPLPHPLAASTDISKLVRADYGGDLVYTALMEEAFAGWDAWNAAWERPLYHQDGWLLLAGEGLREGSFEHAGYTSLKARGFPVEALTAADIEARHPAWRPGRWGGGYVNRRAGWAESGAVVARLLVEAERAGVTLQAGTRALGLLGEERVRGVRTDHGDVLADHTVVAAGSWSTKLLPELGDRIQATGHPVFLLRPPDPEAYRPPRFLPFAADTAKTGWYGFPANVDGIVKLANHGVGVPLDPDGPRDLWDGAEAALRAFLRDALPALADAPLAGTRVCPYADAFDGDFFIDRHPGRAGLVVSSGGSGHGFKFAPVLGRLAADVVEGRPPHPRFAWRAHQPGRHEAARHVPT